MRSRLSHGVGSNRTAEAPAMPFIILAPTYCALAHLYLSRIWISFVGASHEFPLAISYKNSGSWRLGKSILIYPGYTVEMFGTNTSALRRIRVGFNFKFTASKQDSMLPSPHPQSIKTEGDKEQMNQSIPTSQLNTRLINQFILYSKSSTT